MDIYSFRLLLIVLIFLLASGWFYLYFRKKHRQDSDGSLRKRGMDNHSMGPLFLDQVEEYDVAPAETKADETVRQQESQDEQKQEKGKQRKRPALFAKKQKQNDTTKTPKPAKQDIRVIYLQLSSRKREGFSGSALLSMFDRCNLIFGKMDVFHRKINIAGQEKHTFSVINGEEPGTLIPEEINQRSTHRIMFYISLNECYSPLKAFDEMLDVAHNFASSLDGSLYDDQGCSLSEQNIEYQRDIIRDFVHRNQVNSASDDR